MSTQSHTFNAFESNLAGPLAAGATSVAIVSLLGIDAPAYLVIDPDNPLKREWIRVLAITTNTIDNMDRGLEGSNGPGGVGIDHDSDAPIRAIFTAQLQDDIFLDINALETFDADHIIDPDPHPVYLTPAEGNQVYLRLDGTTVPTDDIAMGNNKITGLANATADADAVRRDQVLAADAAHVAAPEPHANYVKLSGDTMTGVLDMGNEKITSLGEPDDNGDAATKQYVDGEISGLPSPFSGVHGDLTGVGAGDHHDRYLDSEAVGAMGGIGNGNALNHVRFSNANAVSAVLAADDYLRKAGGGTFTGELLGPSGLANNPAFAVGNAQTGMYQDGSYIGLSRNGLAVIVGDGDDELYMGGISNGSGDDLQAQGSQIRRVVSSRRFKNVGKAIDKAAIRAKLMALPVYEWAYKDNPDAQIGWMAEDVAEVDSRLVNFDEEGRPNSIRTLAIMAVLT